MNICDWEIVMIRMNKDSCNYFSMVKKYWPLTNSWKTSKSLNALGSSTSKRFNNAGSRTLKLVNSFNIPWTMNFHVILINDGKVSKIIMLRRKQRFVNRHQLVFINKSNIGLYRIYRIVIQIIVLIQWVCNKEQASIM